MKKVILLSLIFAGCSPLSVEEQETKYPEVPTLQSAEDAQHPDKIKL
jgi:hypothetical protein